MPESCCDKNGKSEPYFFNIVTVASKFVDDHLSLVRNISTVLAVAGVITIATSIKLITRFGSPSEIPVRFIERTVSIRGRVRRVTDRGLEVEHVPVYVPIVSHLLTNRQPVAAPLHVRLAGVELTPQGQDWLAQRLRPEEAVWLRLIGRQGDCLHCLVSVSRGLLFSTCVNQEVLRLGLGRTAPLHGLDPRSRLYWKIHKRLLRSELKAERKGEGLWKEPSRSERLIHALRNNTVIMAIKRAWKWMWKGRDQ
ncbi:protein C3orf33 homolog isoform X1 [Electrophorus electricus]|uniref:protein C3orf33 homolog isoform X1 n=1 Tax=Electrophorus electricus TaxID=8005 RepID=UPI0015D02A89|nr:protein C3orf33 homolog isoform X1 [Electrophorus electricus]